MEIIKLRELTKQYGDLTAVDRISLTVNKGELIGFLGVNGAGKSTTINMLSTLIGPSGGTAEICGFSLGSGNKDIRQRIGIVYQQNCLDELLTVRENLLCRGILHGASGREATKRLEQLGEILSLHEILNRKYKTLSGGQKRRCEIAAALMHIPEILFLDEPTTGLDPATRRDVWQAVERLRQETGMTVFLTTHYMEEAAAADRIVIIDRGKIIAEGTPFELKERYALDRVKLYCDPRNSGKLLKALQDFGAVSQKEEYGATFSVRSTLEALPYLNAVKELTTGFEVIGGTMDDVFLNATGKKIS